MPVSKKHPLQGRNAYPEKKKKKEKKERKKSYLKVLIGYLKGIWYYMVLFGVLKVFCYIFKKLKQSSLFAP